MGLFLGSNLKLLFSIGYFSGMREGEILGLEWDQVKFLDGVIRLRAGETKNGEGREIPIAPQLRNLLLEQHAKHQPNCPYVCFRLDRKGHAVKIRGFRKAWYSACIRGPRKDGSEARPCDRRNALRSDTRTTVQAETKDVLSRHDYPRFAEKRS